MTIQDRAWPQRCRTFCSELGEGYQSHRGGTVTWVPLTTTPQEAYDKFVSSGVRVQRVVKDYDDQGVAISYIVYYTEEPK
jgi:hypothetical protein